MRTIKWKVISKLSCFMTFDDEMINFFQLRWEKWSNLYLSKTQKWPFSEVNFVFSRNLFRWFLWLRKHFATPTHLVSKHKNLARPTHPPFWLRNKWMVPYCNMRKYPACRFKRKAFLSKLDSQLITVSLLKI